MEIQYLKTMEANSSFWNRKSRGFSLDKIEELEQKLNNGIPFPKALREYLFLGGEFNSLGFDHEGIGQDGSEWIALKKYYEKEMRKNNLSINRPYVVLDSYDGAIFSFIYLDEGDDPRPYNFSVSESYKGSNGETIYPFPEKTFSQLINRLVDYALRGLQPW